MTRKSYPGGAAPYSAALISLSVPSTPTRRTFTSTPRPFGTWSSDGLGVSAKWTLLGFPGNTLMAFISISPYEFSLRLLRQSPVRICFALGTLHSVALTSLPHPSIRSDGWLLLRHPSRHENTRETGPSHASVGRSGIFRGSRTPAGGPSHPGGICSSYDAI